MLNSRKQLITRCWNREHAKVKLEGSFMCGDTSGRAAILQGIHFIAMLISSSHRGLNATIGKEAT